MGYHRQVQVGLLALVALCTIAVSLWAASSPPATDYETIYRAYPTAFWALVVTGLGAATVVFALSSVTSDGYWKVALLLVCLLYSVFLLLPLFRGWALYGRFSADVLAHIGFTSVVVESGHLSTIDYYPASHLLMAELELLGVPTRVVPTFLSALFTPLYIVGIYLFSRRLFDDHGVAVATLACAVPLFYTEFHHSFLPAIYSFLLVPVFFWTFLGYVETRRASLLAFTLALSAFVVLFHPVTALYVVVALFVAVFARWLYSVVRGGPVAVGPHLLVLVFIGVVWVAWFGQFTFITESLVEVLAFADSGGSTVADEYGADRVEQTRSLGQLVDGFVNLYGPIFLVCALAGFGGLVVALRFWRDEATSAEVWIAVQFLVGVVISVVSLFTYVVAFDPIRNSRYMILMATLLAGLFLYWLLVGETSGGPTLDSDRWGRARRVALVVSLVLLVAAVPVAAANSYDTRYHMTYSERDGASWLYQHETRDRLTVSHHVNDNKMLMYTQRTVDYSPSTVVGIGEAGSPVPKFFGYPSNDTLGETVGDESVYLVTKEYDTEYQLVQREFLRDELVVYDRATLDRLHGDFTADKLYTNDGYTVWLVTPDGGSGEGERGGEADTARSR
ncbi:DUF6541 family protein [Halomarina oriensis]|uniref:Glycosyltransferase RgtA/B/C/D-like domain-containing protein n=1 Tax=Halomarina oriensis TaxID=671145 RepID=A0A6B0GNR5_9EURY|nr:DUF6541 family protein [Halomarina oriensis]MWG36320.1 hypothetical protein [Halomarina oriensis]